MRDGGLVRSNRVEVMVLLLCLFTAMTLVMAAGTPMGVVRDGVGRVLKILSGAPGTHGPSGSGQGRTSIREIVHEHFDFEEMAKRVLGLHWKRQSAEKQREFVRVFDEFLFNVYIGRVEDYSGEEVSYDSENTRGRYAQVKTRILDFQGTDLAVEYRLLLKNGQWKVYDVVVEGVSLVSNYRSQFSSFLASKSFEALMNQMRQKVALQSTS